MHKPPADNGDEGPPPPSQSHFAKFEHFIPNDAVFDDEFARLASSQQWSQSLDNIDEEELSAEEKTLRGYHALCHEVGIDPSDSVAGYKRRLKKTLINIVDLIDARRTGERFKVWESFEEFRLYTLLEENRIDLEEAKSPPGYLASLLQRLSGPSSRRGRKGRSKGERRSRVASSRITKSTA